MYCISSLLALWATLASLCVSAPLPTADVSVHLARRSEAGPELSAANFPDPCIIQVDNVWYAFATRTIGSSIHIQIAKSTDWSTWSIVEDSDGSQKDALPDLPSWIYADDPATWAPDVSQLDNGTFIMYYTASAATNTSKHCVAAAYSDTVEGPYTPYSQDALICPIPQGGAIDPSGFDDNGQRYIAYKIDGNAIGNGGPCGNTVAPIGPTYLMLQPVESDGVTFQGSATELLNNDGAADQGIVEAPDITKSGSTYFLFFSPGCFSDQYSVSFATASSITGPYTRNATPLFSNATDGLERPGGMDIDTDGTHMVFHAAQGSGRALYTAELSFSGTTVSA